MERILLDRVNMCPVMSDFILRNALDTRKSICYLCILLQCLYVKIQALVWRRKSIQAFVNWNLSRFPTNVDSTDFGSVATWQIPGDAHNSSQECSWLRVRNIRQAIPDERHEDAPAQVNSAILEYMAVISGSTEAGTKLTFDWTCKSVGKRLAIFDYHACHFEIPILA